MSPITITPISTLNLQRKYGTLSNYGHRFINSQLRSISFTLKTFFSEADFKLISQNEEKLKNIGFKQIGKDINEGILVSDNKFDYHVYSPKEGYIRFDTINPEDNQISRYFCLKDASDEYIHAGNFDELNIEDEMNRTLDLIENKLFKAKREYMPVPIRQSFIQDKAVTEKLDVINKSLQTPQKILEVKPALIGSNEEGLISSILEKLELIQELYKKIPDGRLRAKVKNSYKNFAFQPERNKIGFNNAGPDGETISLFDTSYKNRAYTGIAVKDVNGKESRFVISKDKKTVQKDFPSRSVKSENSEYRIFIKPKYYTQKEIDESKLNIYLSSLNREMELFIENTQDWFKRREEIKLIKSNYDNATLDQYKEILDDIYSNFEKYRAGMRRYLRKTNQSKKFKKENNISTKLASIAVKFDNITPDGRDLRLSYPKVHDEIATQILVMRDDKIENSFYILNNKLLRFDIKDLNDKIRHYDQKLYYYDSKYLKDSNLYDYLLLLRDKLYELNDKLDMIKELRIKNRKNYNIKTPKDQS